MAYDGSTYTYTVLAHNEKNSSLGGTPDTFEAVGKPDPWGDFTVQATGEDNRVRVIGSAPASRGKQSRAAIIIGNDQVVWELAVATGTPINEVVSTPGNDQPYAVRLRMCNEKAAEVGCSVSEAKAVQTYGPLQAVHLNQPTASVDGRTVTWAVSGTANGDAALVGISIDGGAEQVTPTGGPGAFSLTRVVTVDNFSTNTTIRVRLVRRRAGQPRRGRRLREHPVGRATRTQHRPAARERRARPLVVSCPTAPTSVVRASPARTRRAPLSTSPPRTRGRR